MGSAEAVSKVRSYLHTGLRSSVSLRVKVFAFLGGGFTPALLGLWRGQRRCGKCPAQVQLAQAAGLVGWLAGCSVSGQWVFTLTYRLRDSPTSWPTMAKGGSDSMIDGFVKRSQGVP